MQIDHLHILCITSANRYVNTQETTNVIMNRCDGLGWTPIETGAKGARSPQNRFQALTWDDEGLVRPNRIDVTHRTASKFQSKILRNPPISPRRTTRWLRCLRRPPPPLLSLLLLSRVQRVAENPVEAGRSAFLRINFLSQFITLY